VSANEVARFDIARVVIVHFVTGDRRL